MWKYILSMVLVLLVPFLYIYFNFHFLMEKLSAIMMHHFHQHNKKMRPDRIILIRHGESEANIDVTLYKRVPDSQISLTEKGKEQAREASKKLKEIIKDGSIKFYVSPYLRSRQTYDNLMLNFKENRTSFVYDPRLREQEFGNFHHIEEETFEEMRKVGKFYYRFTNGENGADVYDRASLFLDSLFREIKDIDYKKYDNIVIVCHGLFMRLFMMNFLKYTIEQFDLLATPHNCEFWIIEKNERGKYQLISELKNEENNLN